jgi:hypothetical protein
MSVEALIARAFAAGGKGKVEALLRQTKEAAAGIRDERRPTFRTSGSREQIAEAIREAVDGRHLATHRLAALVDTLEENGAQHIFLYRLTDAGVQALTADRLPRLLPGPPRGPTEAYYADEPTARKHYENRAGVLVIKQIYVAEYWERNERESRETPDRRINVLDRVRRRAVNLVRIRPASREVEVRIDRARPQYDQKLALELFDQFKESLNGIIDFDVHVRALPIWRAFPAIIAARDETYMSTDQGHDPSVAQRLSNLRGGRLGTDIRDHENFRPDNTREHLNVWWRLPNAPGDENDERYIHCVMSRIDGRGDQPERAKVYVGAKAEPEDLEYALGRIRHFAR